MKGKRTKTRKIEHTQERLDDLCAKMHHEDTQDRNWKKQNMTTVEDYCTWGRLPANGRKPPSGKHSDRRKQVNLTQTTPPEALLVKRKGAGVTPLPHNTPSSEKSSRLNYDTLCGTGTCKRKTLHSTGIATAKQWAQHMVIFCPCLVCMKIMLKW